MLAEIVIMASIFFVSSIEKSLWTKKDLRFDHFVFICIYSRAHETRNETDAARRAKWHVAHNSRRISLDFPIHGHSGYAGPLTLFGCCYPLPGWKCLPRSSQLASCWSSRKPIEVVFEKKLKAIFVLSLDKRTFKMVLQLTIRSTQMIFSRCVRIYVAIEKTTKIDFPFTQHCYLTCISCIRLQMVRV